VHDITLLLKCHFGVCPSVEDLWDFPVHSSILQHNPAWNPDSLWLPQVPVTGHPLRLDCVVGVGGYSRYCSRSRRSGPVCYSCGSHGHKSNVCPCQGRHTLQHSSAMVKGCEGIHINGGESHKLCLKKKLITSLKIESLRWAWLPSKQQLYLAKVASINRERQHKEH